MTNPRASALIQRELSMQLAQSHGFLVVVLEKVQSQIRHVAHSITLVIFAYAYARVMATGGWASTVRAGFAGAGQCQTLGATYAAVNTNVLVSNNDDAIGKGKSAAQFIPSILDTSSTTSQLCFTAQQLSRCLPVFATGDFSGLTVETLTNQFSDQASDYNILQNATWIIATVSMLLVSTIIVDAVFDNAYSLDGPQQRRLANEEQKAVLVRSNVFLTVLLVALLVTASHQFILIRQLDCLEQKLCPALSSCGAVVKAVVEPRDDIVRSFREVSLFCAIFIAVAAFVKKPGTLSGRHRAAGASLRRARAQTAAARRQQQLLLERQQGVAAYLRRVLGLGSHDAVFAGADGGDVDGNPDDEEGGPFAARMRRIQQRNRMIAGWRHFDTAADWERTRGRVRGRSFSRGVESAPGEQSASDVEAGAKAVALPDATAISLDGQICSICLDLLLEQEAKGEGEGGGGSGSTGQLESGGLTELNCGHLFHFRCICEWSLRQESCPECRAKL